MMRRVITILIVVLLSTMVAQGQIKIGGNVYGGGNHAEVRGSSNVTVKAGDIGAVLDPNASRPLADPQGRVFGGARMADVKGSSFVHIDGENATGYILINQVFGGNDIAGKIGKGKDVGEDIPTALSAVKRVPADATDSTKNVVDNSFNSYVRVSTKATSNHYTAEEIAAASTNPEADAYGKRTTDVKPDPTAKKVYIGQLFAGGNGDFIYTDDSGNPLMEGDEYIIKQVIKQDNNQVETVIGRSKTPFVLPEVDSTYLEVVGGSIVYAYGGGNNVTVNKQNIIHIDNPSAVVNHILVDAAGVEGNTEIYETYETNKANGINKPPTGYTDLLSEVRFKEMGINTTFSQPSSGAYQIGRFFGGNNKAEMSIRPTWNLLAGKVRNLYSGGNRGNMTSPEGLLLEIQDYSSLIVDNLYGGCRMADVKPTENGEYTPCKNLPGYKFPNELSARTLVRGGYVHNVYGGNDVTGTVYGGNAVGIYTNVYGNVYGGGNGAYPYTDNENKQNDEAYGDFWYDGGNSTMDSLRAFRPNAEQVSIRLKGTDARHQTIIHGSVFVGGNCASLNVKKKNPLIELKMGSHVVCDNVYLGNNGEGMIDTTYLKLFAQQGFNSWTLTDPVEFSDYMEGVAMTQQPRIVFDNVTNGDPAPYKQYSSYVGSFFCGGNVGSMAIPGKMTFSVDSCLNIYNKFVGGCNNADVPAQDGLNAFYEGGIIGSKEERGEGKYTDSKGNIKDRLEINFRNLAIMPLRWNDTFTQVANGTTLTAGKEYYHTDLRSTKFIAEGTEKATEDSTYYELTSIGDRLVWNTAEWSTDEDNFVSVANNAVNDSTRLLEGNIYGGCYNSGHINGNIVINIDEDVLRKDDIFGTGTSEFFGQKKSGVGFENQRDDVMAVALSVFGAGYGEKTEVWGSTTANLNKGYALQIFGGGELGVVGKREHDPDGAPIVDAKGNYSYNFDPKYSTTVNLNGAVEVYSKDGTVENLAEAEFLYGGGNEGLICGNSFVNLGKGRIYDAFGGSSDADILGHTEVYIGRQPNGSGGYKDGFPWINDIVYGGNDFGGTIHGAYEDNYNFKKRLRNATEMSQLHGYKANGTNGDDVPDVLKSSSYVEYLQGRVDTIFGGGYGAYDYTNKTLYGNASMPEQHSSFVNIRPKDHAQNALKAVFGGGTGYPGNRDDDKAQDRSYVLVDIPDGMKSFSQMEVFGAGSYNGLGMKYTFDSETGKTVDESGTAINLDEASAIIDLLHGNIHNAYGGSYQEGVTRRTVVNVPKESTIQIDSIFGGAYGKYILPPCDVYETQVNYNNTSEKAQTTAIFGGNNKERRSLFTQVNISSPVYSNKSKGYTAMVFGAGKGIDTWSEHTEVNLLDGARVYKVYGGGEMGHVLNSASVQAYMNLYKTGPSPQIGDQDPYWKVHKDDFIKGGAAQTAAEARWAADWKNAWTLGSYYEPGKSNGETAETAYTKYATNAATSLDHFSNRAELDDKTAAQLDGRKKHNTNVIINKGAVVEGYAYGGGLGDVNTDLSGDIYGHTYVAVLGGQVDRDVYAGGEAGGVDNLFGANDFAASGNKFTASANAYIQGGTVRNVYGGGYKGNVGHHTGDITATFAGDRPANANVVIGKAGTNTIDGGAPAITRNVYGGGEGGSVYGTSHVTLNNGYVGYRYTDSKYVEELKDKEPGDLDLSGNVFGGGYVVNSYVDNTNIDMYGGQVRGSLYGGGEVGPIGRGALKTGLSTGLENGDATIFRAGKTQVNMYDGKVLRNIFGGGRGKDSWGGDGTMYMDKAVVESLKSDGLFCKGYIFGQTRVNIHGGEVGTDEGMLKGYGNVFGGCDEGTVYSALQEDVHYTQAEIEAASEGDPAYGKTTNDVKTPDVLFIGKKIGARYDGNHEGYYFEHDGIKYLTHADGETNIFTEDCKVVVEPHAQAYVDLTIPGGTGSPRGDGSYKAGEYVTTVDLNKLKSKNDENLWGSLDPDGIIIHNAVFAGGNIAAGSSSLYANATTDYGNATASIHDVYNRDLITIGTGHTGGLYGDGNLTFVDGYRELNITNYGTDYYHIVHQLEYDEYEKLPEREKAYYELKYKCLKSCTDNEGTTYSEGSNLPMDELLALFTKPNGQSVLSGGDTGDSIIVTNVTKKVPNPSYWQENGVVSVYAGRIMNTIQRADFCGVFGSRMVMKGAQDRVPEIADYTNYTINRVREVSLNKKNSVAGDTGDNALHGNYFGIYSNVNYLGALTSDVSMDSLRTTNADLVHYPDLKPASATETFSQWKQAHKNEKSRNNGTCHNHLALASGVYLELTTEKSTGNTLDTKDWGPITGVIELDLINVQTGIGGGFVYARNEHGVRDDDGIPNATLTALNEGAASKWNYTYDGKYNNWEESDEAGHKEEWQTSGNFIHSSQTIIDDCYNVGSKYKGKYGNKDHGGTSEGVPAHYWYIAGSVYVYDQYISAYTGSPNAFSETVEVPITINAASHGTMTLMDVQPNLYAYYSTFTDASNNTLLSGDKKLVINDVTYKLNDPISYWDWNKLPASEKKLFVTETYVLKDSCYINSKFYPEGYVMLPSEYSSLKSYAENKEIDHESVKAVKKATKNADGEEIVEKDSNGQDVYVAFDDAFRSSNNMSHTTGYLLTYNVTNPKVWDKWYTQVQDKVVGEDYVLVKNQTGGAGFEDGPTYYPTTSGIYGQQPYDVNAIISKFEYDKYNGYNANNDEDYTDADDVYGLKQMYPTISSRTDQAVFVPAHLVTKECTSAGQHYYPGAPVSAAISDYTEPAYVCTATIQISPTEYIYVNDLMTETQKTTYYNKFNKVDATAAEKAIAKDINDLIVPAYYCTTAGLYGGSYYENNKNYRALEAYSAMSPTDRENFTFNYDALDLLIDPTYGGTAGRKYQYDSADGDLAGAEANAAHYSLITSIDYTATYRGDTALIYKDANKDVHTVAINQELTSTVYETLPNEQHHYAPITVDKAGDYYVVKESFVHGETPYAVGTVIDSGTFDRLAKSEKDNYIDTLTFAAGDVKYDASSKPIPYYYCRESYKVNENGEGATVSQYKSSIGTGNTSYAASDTVPVGYVIDATNYNILPNRQKNFTIHGVSPMETSTLYVARNADINDLSTEKIITVVYKYDYEESDKDGTHITPVSERHVVNIHINFKSGVPTVEDINTPSIVLPGTGITMRPPSVTPGAYEITGGGWELFEKPSDAESHINGVPYKPSEDPLYWYQDGFYLAYYAKTFLGKTYSNHVPVSVANYHDLKKVMDDKTYHLHVDYDRSRLKRNSKIYINDYSGSSQNGLDLFKDFFDLSLLTNTTPGITLDHDTITNAGRLRGHTLLNNSTEEVTLSDGTKVKRGVLGGENLEFFLRTDIDHPASWTTIGTDDVCFKGNLHGDGHTISGLNNSLFYNLCGSVYNLGVMGSFNSAGVADKGTGYVESAWVKTSAASTDLSPKPYPVFGAASDDKGYQVVNSYYYNGNKGLYTTTEGDAEITYARGSKGNVKGMSANAFYNGELAYDLNNFYLHKRYANKKGTVDETKLYDRYFTVGDDGKLAVQPYKSYESRADLCSSGYTYTPEGESKSVTLKYVEERFADGDYRYAAGEIPDSEDERFCSWTVTDPDTGKETLESGFFPIWPDDYIYFGQKLTYGWAAQAHQNVPTAVARDDGRLSTGTDANRVYRAPAYYRSKVMGMAHFNPQAYLAQKEKDGSKAAYPNMTAIDFKGHYDGNNGAYAAYGTYGLGNETGLFYTPLLDDDGLLSIQNCDETQNIVVYAPAADANAKTYSVLNSYFTEPAYSEDNTKGYRLVAEASAASVHGHLVQSNKITTNDHLLVDYQDFNAPIAYTLGAEKRMWYQRLPHDKEYVNLTKGWQGISIPFTAELVTTDTKGEITHFYSGSDESQNGTKKGHEYWLRELTDGSIMTEKSTNVLEANFHYPNAAGDNKTVSNTFLWDYYYENTSVHNRKDLNADKYQQYYKSSRTYNSYPLLQAAKPYILGLPSDTYYEFDLSGNFEAKNTAVSIPVLGKQIITFASIKGIGIGVSDDEMAGTTVTYSSNNYTFKPSYMNESLTNGNFVMNSDGNAYVQLSNAGTGKYHTTGSTYADAAAFAAAKDAAVDGKLYTDADGTVEAGDYANASTTYYSRVSEITKNEKNNVTTSLSAFRPYFTGPAVAPSRKFEPESIQFGNDYSSMEGEFKSAFDGDLEIDVQGHKIVTTSHLKEATTVRIINVSGNTIANYVIQPDETVETPIFIEGVYIVNKKKLLVK